jgi:nucleoside-diphosphate-sugar epimerase
MVELLVKNGWDVTGTDLTGNLHKEYYCENGALHPMMYEDFVRDLGVKFITADLTNKESLYPLFNGKPYDAIFHTASLYDYFAKWDVLYKINVEGTRNLAELVVKHGVGRFIHWSTDGVYGSTKEEPADENAPYAPGNDYSKSKMEQEKVLLALYEEKGLPLTIIRPAPIYGPRHRYGVYHILYGIKKIGTGVSVSFYPKRKTLMMPSVHVTDLVRAALFVSDKEEAVGQAYNVLSDCIPQSDWMEFAARALGLEHTLRIPVLWPMYVAFAKISRMVISKLDRKARAMGTRPKIDVPMVEYLTHQYWFSNQKIKDLGFELIYEDPRKGIWDYITWCRERGWL